MSTVTSHSLLNRPVRSSASPSLGCLKPAVVVLPFAPPGKRTPRSICYSMDPKSTNHPYDISPIALVHPNMPPTSTLRWEIKEDDKNVKLTFFNMPETAKTGDFQVGVEDDVLVIKTKPKPSAERQGEPADGGISLDVRLFVPKGYDRENVQAELQLRALVITVPKANPAFTKQVFIEGK